MTLPAAPDPAREAWLNMSSCPTCGSRRIFGEAGWRCCDTCHWDEMPRSITNGLHPIHDAGRPTEKTTEGTTCQRV